MKTLSEILPSGRVTSESEFVAAVAWLFEFSDLSPADGLKALSVARARVCGFPELVDRRG